MPDLPKRILGRTGLAVTTLGYGSSGLSGGPATGRYVSEEQAERILNAVLDAGINYIDTAIDYGLAEEQVGRYLSRRRSEFFLAAKCGCLTGDLVDNPPAPIPGHLHPHVYTRENILRGVEQSLRNMKTEYLDLVQFHSTLSRAQLEEYGCLDPLQELQQQGKVRFIGISGTIPHLNDQIEMGVFDVLQIPYSALARQHEALIEKASKGGAGIVIRGGVAKGGAGKEQGASWETWQRAGMDDLLGEMSRQEFILRFTISLPELDTTIVGTTNPDHLQDNIKAVLAGPLPADVYAEAKRRLEQAGSAPVAVPTN